MEISAFFTSGPLNHVHTYRERELGPFFEMKKSRAIKILQAPCMHNSFSSFWFIPCCIFFPFNSIARRGRNIFCGIAKFVFDDRIKDIFCAGAQLVGKEKDGFELKFSQGEKGDLHVFLTFFLWETFLWETPTGHSGSIDFFFQDFRRLPFPPLFEPIKVPLLPKKIPLMPAITEQPRRKKLPDFSVVVSSFQFSIPHQILFFRLHALNVSQATFFPLMCLSPFSALSQNHLRLRRCCSLSVFTSKEAPLLLLLLFFFFLLLLLLLLLCQTAGDDAWKKEKRNECTPENKIFNSKVSCDFFPTSKEAGEILICPPSPPLPSLVSLAPLPLGIFPPWFSV